MTTRNFRVNNGLEVGDITISATANKVMAININKKILSIVFVYNRVVNILNLKEVIVI